MNAIYEHSGIEKKALTAYQYDNGMNIREFTVACKKCNSVVRKALTDYDILALQS